MKARKIIIGLVILGLLGLAAKIFLFKQDFSFAGTLEATKVDLSAQLPSTIFEVKVREGDHVTHGQELITLSCEDYKIALQLANQNYDRNNRLFKSGTVSEDTLEQFKNRKQETDLHLKWCSIASPINGTILSRYHEPGEWVSPGLKLLTLANIQDIWTYIYVPQPEVSKLKVGMKLIGRVPEIKDRIFEGTIIKINSEAEFTPKNVQTQSERTRLVFGIKVSFLGSNQDEILKPGMTIEIKL
ncbi:MAG: efflux RND transporter periplasmic adaptor subunit [Myxococcaceae bacterium]